MRLFRKLACCTLLGWACSASHAQAPSSAVIYSTDNSSAPADTTRLYTIRNFIISGNKKTNPNIILRELSFQVDQSYPLAQITGQFEKARKQLMNTGLFSNVTVPLQNVNGTDV